MSESVHRKRQGITSRMHCLAQVWRNSPLTTNNLHSTNSLCCHGTAAEAVCINSDVIKYRSDVGARFRGASTTGTRFMQDLVHRCIPTAVCLSQKSNLGDTSLAASTSFEGVDEDSLPGMRIQRKGVLEQRKNMQISEQELSEWLNEETGVDRVQMMFAVGPDGCFVQEATQSLNTMFYRTVVMGTLLNIVSVAVARSAGNKEKDLVGAQSALKGAVNEQKAFKGILVESVKRTSRIVGFSASMLNTTSVWEYAVSSSFGFGILGLGEGMKRCAKLALRGAILGTVGGFVVCQFLASHGVNQEQKHLDSVRHHLQVERLKRQK